MFVTLHGYSVPTNATVIILSLQPNAVMLHILCVSLIVFCYGITKQQIHVKNLMNALFYVSLSHDFFPPTNVKQDSVCASGCNLTSTRKKYKLFYQPII